MTEYPLAMLFEISLRTLAVCLPALLAALAVGVPLGILLGGRRFPGRNAVIGLVNSGMGIPPVVVGLGLALLLWRSGPLGFLSLMYTVEAMMIAQFAIALPLVVAITLAAVGALDESFDLQVRTLGVPRGWRLWLLLREIRIGLLTAVIAGLGAVLSSVAGVLMVGGNLEGETRVLTTSILMFTRRGEYELASSLALVLFGLMLVLSLVLTAVQQGDRR